MGTLSKTPAPQIDSLGNPFSTVGGEYSTSNSATAFTGVVIAPAKIVAPKPAPDRIYELHEFDPDGIVTGKINPDQIDPLLYKPVDRSSNGTVLIDKNKDLTNQKTLISLNVSKTSNVKFNQVIDATIQEFTEDLDSTISFLENKVASLESGTQRNRADKAALAAQIAELNAQIASLRDQLALAVDPGRNNIVSDTLAAGGELISIEDGTNGRPVKNILLSRNRMAKGKMQGDGNFVIFTGNYDFNGNPIGPENIVWGRGFDNKQDLAPSRFMVFKLSGGGNGSLETVRVDGTNFFRTWFVGDRLTSKARVQLTDAGILNLYDGPNVIWSSYGT
jgi:hypothetical protein